LENQAARGELQESCSVLCRIQLAFMLVVFVVLSVALRDEIYRCEVLEIPNCD
jgi:hypothetical protein